MSKSLSSSSNNVQQGMMQNPFEVSDEQILDDVYRTHFQCLENFEVTSLHTVASNVINHSIEITQEVIDKSDKLKDRYREDASISSQQLAAKLKRIAYLMICTPRGEQAAHRTTMLILEQLKHYSWDAKAVIIEAAFALEYGKFMYLPVTPLCQPCETSFADLNGLLMLPQNTQNLSYFSTMVNKAMQMVECISEWKGVISAGHDMKDVPSLQETLQEIPVVVYWTIFTFVSCTGQIDEFSDNKAQRHELPKSLENKLDNILRKFKELVDKCSKEIGRIEDYTRRKNIVTRTGKDIVKVLRALIIPGENKDSRHNVFNVLTEEQVQIEELKKKYVLLFISGLEDIEDEIKLLKSINEKLKEKPKEVEGYRYEDFKILWIPIVEEWNEERRRRLQSILQRNKFGWYVVKNFNFETGIRLIKEVFGYKEKPIIPLINPQGRVENIDTKQIISAWDIDGFPFRSSDHTRLTQQWNWFWSEMNKFKPSIENMVEEDCYLFIYGGTNTKWIQEFTTVIGTLKKEIEDIKLHTDLITFTIESYQLGKENPKLVPHFWIGIESLLTSKKPYKMKGGERGQQDFATSEIKRLLFLKQDPKGWVILSKGHNVKLLGHGEAMSRTIKEFDSWREKLHGVSFDVALKEYYEGIKDKDSSKKCEENVISYGYPTDIVERIPCPKKDCRRPMEVTSVNYKCCHNHKQ
ncbi:hypothetical protein VNO78_12481 [Psophocarpus tetragonolobus]|uniref:Protein SIEVE ELEMENT OCCLUSION B n=1 Tax=Psophocarpus tetragonolobus TaxID=3891 RepID=A0AAN9SQ04_PSOTE